MAPDLAWNPWTIQAALKRRGIGLRTIAREFDINDTCVRKAIGLDAPGTYVGHRIKARIAELLGVPQATLWPPAAATPARTEAA